MFFLPQVWTADTLPAKIIPKPVYWRPASIKLLLPPGKCMYVPAQHLQLYLSLANYPASVCGIPFKLWPVWAILSIMAYFQLLQERSKFCGDVDCPGSVGWCMCGNCLVIMCCRMFWSKSELGQFALTLRSYVSVVWFWTSGLTEFEN